MASLFVPRNSRELAFAVLNDTTQRGVWASDRLEQFFQDDDWAANEKSLARELVTTVIRRTATLDALLQPAIKRPWREIEAGLLTVLRLGAAQLALLDGIAPHAALFETVELARRVGRSGWPGFVNGVLRAVQRLVTTEFITQPAANAVPVAHDRYRLLANAVFSDPGKSAAKYFAQAFSFPDWLSRRWSALYPFDELCRLGFWFNTPAPLTLRVNLLRTTRQAVLEALDQAGIPAIAGQFPESLCLAGTCAVSRLPGFAEGHVTVQDESSMFPVRWLDPQPGERVWDVCAAPGGKTTHLAELQQDQGQITATDVAADRLELIRQNAGRLGLKSIQVQGMSRDFSDAPEGPFDAVLVDAPCSNTGVLGKRPEARWRVKPADLNELVQRQRGLLQMALTRVRSGGRAVYSTCSIEPEENQQLVSQVLTEQPGWRLVREQTHQAGCPSDGGYVALLSRE